MDQQPKYPGDPGYTGCGCHNAGCEHMRVFTGKDRLHHKYKIEKQDGSPVDPKAEYFVLRIDKDPHARKALRAYIRSIKPEAPKFAADLTMWLASTVKHGTDGVLE